MTVSHLWYSKPKSGIRLRMRNTVIPKNGKNQQEYKLKAFAAFSKKSPFFVFQSQIFNLSALFSLSGCLFPIGN